MYFFRSCTPLTSGKSCKHPESQGDDDVMNLSPNESTETVEDCLVEALESEIAREDEEFLPSGWREKMSCIIRITRGLLHGCHGLRVDWGVPQGVVLYKVTTVTGLFWVF